MKMCLIMRESRSYKHCNSQLYQNSLKSNDFLVNNKNISSDFVLNTYTLGKSNDHYDLCSVKLNRPVPVAARSKA